MKGKVVEILSKAKEIHFLTLKKIEMQTGKTKLKTALICEYYLRWTAELINIFTPHLNQFARGPGGDSTLKGRHRGRIYVNEVREEGMSGAWEPHDLLGRSVGPSKTNCKQGMFWEAGWSNRLSV